MAKPRQKTYKLSDAHGLYLEVAPNGSRCWRWKYCFDGKEKRLALGVYPVVLLAQIRHRASEPGVLRSFMVEAGQQLKLRFPSIGARACIAIAGGVDVPPVLGSRSSFHECGVGGLDGHALKRGQSLPVAYREGTPGMRVKAAAIPQFSNAKTWSVEAVAGPTDDWLDSACRARFFTAAWKVTGKCPRSGYRLDGPKWTFSPKALAKSLDHGPNPNEIIDDGYPLGAVNLGGQTPIILLIDGFSIGGLINPFTVPTAAFWKLAQARPGDSLFFREVSVDEAQALRRQLDAICTMGSIEPA